MLRPRIITVGHKTGRVECKSIAALHKQMNMNACHAPTEDITFYSVANPNYKLEGYRLPNHRWWVWHINENGERQKTEYDHFSEAAYFVITHLEVQVY